MRHAFDRNCMHLPDDGKIERWLRGFEGPSIITATVMIIGIRSCDGLIYRVITTTAPHEYQACVRFLRDEIGLVNELGGAHPSNPLCDAIFRQKAAC